MSSPKPLDIRVIIRHEDGFVETSEEFDGTTWEAHACRLATEAMGEPHNVDYRLPDVGDPGTITFAMRNGRRYRDTSPEDVAARFGSDPALFLAFSAIQSGARNRLSDR